MNWLVIVPILWAFQMASPQVETGTILFINFTPDDLTVAADSRRTFGDTGKYDDTDCKISAFGNKFVFAMAGGVFTDAGRNPRSIARQIWTTESRTEESATKLVPAVAEKWTTRMEQVYAESGEVGNVRKHTGGEVLANAFFAATDGEGRMALVAVNIDFDGRLFDTYGQVRVTHDIQNFAIDSWASAGLDEVADEYRLETSDRARKYMARFRTEISALTPREQRAKLATKFVELSIRLHPRKAELGLPVDVLQLKPVVGITWVSLKTNCPQN